MPNIWVSLFLKRYIFLRLLLQVSTEASGQADEMSMSFGCSLKDCRHLLEKAKELGVNVVGVRWVLCALLKENCKRSTHVDIKAPLSISQINLQCVITKWISLNSECCFSLRSRISTSCDDNQVYLHAISDARCVFDMGVSHLKATCKWESCPIFSICKKLTHIIKL